MGLVAYSLRRLIPFHFKVDTNGGQEAGGTRAGGKNYKPIICIRDFVKWYYLFLTKVHKLILLAFITNRRKVQKA
ncbi:hypothetical protein DP113_01885 [Brasilonema octagenarum UFV-E1]|jgi:hypothetical protein|uniref:Uncharacterized protein n=2 Tax=Brasilonema TaxID=383614 RepID=A0A856M6M8_9CYAN|nr:hypothetical protein [Brasilonema octagenarum UFV-OR1]QDL06823.1 hypothetical protein DP114_01925 [Brasilonema sennae CENA114]QDL13189.1 hypothetical protein DP113_01885 [Brasilonema octagenarum UFV-E1]